MTTRPAPSSPVYRDPSGRAEIHRDDAVRFLRALPEGRVDLLVTDPAYSGMNNRLKLGRGRIVGTYADKGDGEGKWFAEFEDSEANYAALLAAMKHALNPETGHLYIMFDSFSLLSLGPIVRDYFDVKNLITWDKVHFGMGHYFRRRHEFIVFATAGNARKLSGRSFPDVWRIKRLHKTVYPTQKPVELFGTMVRASAEPGYLVCDPFVGSGSSAIAALKHGCRFAGADVSKKAVGICVERVEGFLRQGIDTL